MEDTGRINRTISEELQKIIYGENSNAGIEDELKYVVKIDKAHILMLHRQNYLTKEQTQNLLQEIEKLEKCKFNPLRNKSTPRGIYFLYEDYLREKLGDGTGGMLQFGRSRNDLKATVLKLRIREPYLLCIDKLIELINLLIVKSEEYYDVIMPIYTHYQPALPITYGHYLEAIAEEFINITESFLMNSEIDKSPLGAGAAGGTTIRIDTKYTAQLLGFDNEVNNSIIGVASRKIIQDFLLYLVEIESLVSRCCEDYLLWTSSDLKFVELPDELVGGSSMMPNKRNAFLFENIRGKCSHALGGLVAAVTAMKGEPFTNSIAVGTEAVSYIWDSFNNTYNILVIIKEIISKAKPVRKSMYMKNEEGYTLATEYANYLTLKYKISFRSAHKIIGSLVKESINTGVKLEVLIADWIRKEIGLESEVKLDITTLVKNTNYGWGPGEKSFNNIRKNNHTRLVDLRNMRDKRLTDWQESDRLLLHEMETVRGA